MYLCKYLSKMVVHVHVLTSCSDMVIDMLIHPRDLNLLFVAYEGTSRSAHVSDLADVMHRRSDSSGPRTITPWCIVSKS